MEKINIKKYQRITANILYIIETFNSYLQFQKVYLNHFEVFRNFLKNNAKIKVILKNKQSFVLSARSTAVVAFLHNEKLGLNLEKDIITIQKKSDMISERSKIIFHNAIENGDVYRIFIKNEYADLNVKGKTIVDIGANIGDSTIYFALKGADKIIGFEPFYNNYHFAKKNIKENSLEEKCKIFLAGCSGKSGSIKLDPNIKSDVDSKLQFSSVGKEIPLYSLHHIINNFNIPHESILKMDCEGCEYESILMASSDTLRTFDEIFLEYHHGYVNLRKKLEKSGFKVSITTPVSTGFIGKYLRMFKMKKDRSVNNNKNDFRSGYYGLIYAVKN